MIKLEYNHFYQLSLLEKAELLEKNNIFKPFDRSILKSISDQETDEYYKIRELLRNDSTKPTENALQEVFNLINGECQKLLDGIRITDVERYYTEKFNKEIIKVADEAKPYYIKKLRKNIIKRFFKSESILFIENIKLDKIDILKYFESFWFMKPNLFKNSYENKSLDILNAYVFSTQFNRHQYLSLIEVYEELEFVIGNQRALDFLKLRLIEIKSGKIDQNKKVSVNKYPKIFKSDFAFEVFFHTIKNEGNLKKRLFSIYFITFESLNLIYKYRGLQKEYIKMIEKEFNIEITRIETDIPKDITGKMDEIEYEISRFNTQKDRTT